MKIGIDASNIISGGGVTHLVEILRAVNIKKHNIKKLDVWAPQQTLDKIDSKKGIGLRSHGYLEDDLFHRIYWQRTMLTNFAKNNYDVLYVPGGSYTGSFRPVVTMNRNLLPFDKSERQRYGLSVQGLRLRVLEKIQSYTYRRAEGVIFLSEEAKRQTEQTMRQKLRNARIIPHGIAEKFFNQPKKQKPIESYSFKNPYRFLYVSTVTVYKHQWHVIKAIQDLRDEGYPVVLDLVGGITTKKGGKLLYETLNKCDPDDEFVFYHGHQPHEKLVEFHKKADSFVFASSCETFGQTLLEAMASGLSIACSDRSAMTEVLSDTGRYFDPENPESIVQTLKNILDSSDLRRKLAMQAYKRAQTYSWEKCANETFGFIQQVYQES